VQEQRSLPQTCEQQSHLTPSRKAQDLSSHFSAIRSPDVFGLTQRRYLLVLAVDKASSVGQRQNHNGRSINWEDCGGSWYAGIKPM